MRRYGLATEDLVADEVATNEFGIDGFALEGIQARDIYVPLTILGPGFSRSENHTL